jgi:hypothetical protein
MILDTALVSLWLDRFNIWRDHEAFYNKKQWPALLAGDEFDYCHHQDLEKIKCSTKSTIVIDNLTESWHSRRYFRQYPVDRKYIIFSGGSWCKEAHRLPFCYKAIFSQWEILETADTYLSPHRFCFYSDTVLDFHASKPWLFVSTIGNERPVRTRLVEQLCQNFQNDPVLIKYSGQCIVGSDDGLDCITVEPGEFDPYTQLSTGYFHTISQTLPIKLYNSAWFNLVVETDIDYHDVFFVTEKTVKCLLTGMPFVMVATPYFLRNLRNLGFMTYDSLWSEDYDSIVDTDNRIKAVVNLCANLRRFDWVSNTAQLQKNC